MQLTVCVYFVLLPGCSKKDLRYYYGHIQQQGCQVVSVNPQKEKPNDFTLERTTDKSGVLRHIRAEVFDIYGGTFLFDYEIQYSGPKAFLKGSTRYYTWEYDNPPIENPNGPNEDPGQDPPVHLKEDITKRDARTVEVSLDRRTGHATEMRYAAANTPAVRLSYNGQGRLTRVNDYLVETDGTGNILSVLLPPNPESYNQRLGIRYTYNEASVAGARKQFYEAVYVFVHPLYSLLELLDWGPFQPTRERVGVEVTFRYQEVDLPPYIPDPSVSAMFYDHQYDASGRLTGYEFLGHLHNEAPYYSNVGLRHRLITWDCHNKAGK